MKNKTNLRILFDGPFYSTPHAGIARYFNNISRKLTFNNEIYFSRRIDQSHPKEVNLPSFRHFRPHRLSFQLEKLWFQVFNRSHFDIIHLVEYELSPTGLFFRDRGSKLVVTIHDLIHEQIGAPLNLLDKNKRENLYQNADALIFDSYATRNDFQIYYPDVNLDQKVNSVIWLGCSFNTSQMPRNEKKHQFLFLGARNGYKNFITAINAFIYHSQSFEDAQLTVVGSAPTPCEQEIVNSNKINVRWLTYSTDEVLKELYQESIALLYLSNKEGFGLPLVEAMSMGCVPLAGNHSSLSEVLGNGGVYVDQKDPRDVASKMDRLFIDHNFRANKIQSGFDRSKVFSWDITSKKILSTYHSIFNH